MVRGLKTKLLVSLVVAAAGCNQQRGGPAAPAGEGQKVTIADLAPAPKKDKPNIQVLSAVSVHLATFDIPAEKFGGLDGLWSMLDAGPVRLSDVNAFAANAFRIGVGSTAILDKVIGVLGASQGRRSGGTVLLIPDGQADSMNVARMPAGSVISYFSSESSVEHRQLSAGNIGLRVSVRKLSGAKTLCNIQAVPVFFVSTEGLPERLAERVRESEFRFGSTGFGLRMRAGDFILLGPARRLTDRQTLGGLFFTAPAEQPTIRVYLLICTQVT